MKKILIASFLSLSILISGCSNNNNNQNIVTINFPSSLIFLDENYINEIKNEDGVYDVITNENSTEFLLSPEMLEQFKKYHILETNEYINYLIETYSSIENISYSEDLSEFIIYTNSDSITDEDRKISYDLIMQGLLYQPFLNEDISNLEIVVNFLNSNKIVERIVSNSNDYLINSQDNIE